jgi:hypothetical protein
MNGAGAPVPMFAIRRSNFKSAALDGNGCCLLSAGGQAPVKFAKYLFLQTCINQTIGELYIDNYSNISARNH